MEDYTTIKQVLKMSEGIATVGGWIQTVRSAKKGKLYFISLNDGTSFKSIQIVFTPKDDSIDPKTIYTGCSISVTGKIVKSIGKGQEVEIQADKVILLGDIGDPATYPLPKQKQSLDKLRSMLHLRSRTQIMRAVMRIRNSLAMATHKFFQKEDCIWLHTPIITGSDCEGAGEMFQVTTILSDDSSTVPTIPSEDDMYYGKIDYEKDFFKKKAYLTVSGQLDAEMYACGMGSVYTFGPTFRAEKSNTTRHLAEFWMVEPEIAFKELDGIAKVAEDYIKFMIETVLLECEDELTFLEERKEKNKGLIDVLKITKKEDFIKITYSQAIEYLKEAVDKGKEFEQKVEWGIDLGSDQERYMTDELFKKPVIVTHYPSDIKSFYMKEEEDETFTSKGQTVKAMDILVPGIGELVGGSQREDRYDVLCEKIEKLGLSIDDYKEYLDLRKYGTVPHSGFGLGFERMIRFVCGLDNIREAIPFPRWPGHL
jgi:asparaginyl-tRNA synthetase